MSAFPTPTSRWWSTGWWPALRSDRTAPGGFAPGQACRGIPGDPVCGRRPSQGFFNFFTGACMNRVDVFSGLETQSISVEVLREKYAKGEETSIVEIQQRVARALAAVEKPRQRARYRALFLDAQQRGFIPAGRINSAAGTDLAATLINCFVQPVGDRSEEH